MQQKILNSLNSLQGVDNQKRKEAENYLMMESVANFGNLINVLLDILTDPEVGTDGNTITAGLVLKTLFAWESQEKMREVDLKWSGMKKEEQNALKNKLMRSLTVCSGSVGGVLGQCLGAVARIEVVNKRWPEVFPDLATLFLAPNATEVTLINVMETIGILCMNTAGMDEEIILSSSGHILTVLINGTRNSELEVQRSAFKNLARCLEFISHNITIENECVIIMESLFNACSSPDERVACLALECYTKTLCLYYNLVIKYVGLAFGRICMNYLCTDSERKILSAIEMWGTIAEHESETGNGEIIKKVFSSLVGQCVVLARNTDLEQTDEWVPHKAAAWLLKLVAQCAPENVSHEIVNDNLSNAPIGLINVIKNLINTQDPVRVESGMIVLGSILNENTALILSSLIKQNASQIYAALNYNSPVVLDTGLWLFERLFRYAYSAMEMCHLDDQIIGRIMKLISLNTDTSVTAAWTLTGIVSAVRMHGQTDSRPDHAIFSNFTMILDSLVSTFYMLPMNEYTLCVALSSAISEIVKAAIPTYYPQVLGFLSELVSNTKTQLLEANPNEEIVTCYMNMIQACISTCSADQISFAASSLVNICVYIIDRSNSHTLYTEAYLTLGLLADRIGIDFGNYTEEVVRFVVRDLEAFCQGSFSDEEGASIFAKSLIMFVGSMAFAVQLGFSPYVGQIVPPLIKLVGSPYLVLDVKCTTISTFSDIALSVGKIFDKYLEPMVNIAVGVVKIRSDGSDSASILAIREAVLVLFSCIVQASNGKSRQIVGYVEVMLEIIRVIVVETEDSVCAIKALHLISDFWILYGTGEYPSIVVALENQWILDFISINTQSDIKAVRDAAVSARLQINYINND